MCDLDKEDGHPFRSLPEEDAKRHQCKLMHYGADVYEECQKLKLLNIEKLKLKNGTPGYNVCVAKIESLQKIIDEKEQMQIDSQRKGKQ